MELCRLRHGIHAGGNVIGCNYMLAFFNVLPHANNIKNEYIEIDYHPPQHSANSYLSPMVFEVKNVA